MQQDSDLKILQTIAGLSSWAAFGEGPPGTAYSLVGFSWF